MTAMISSTQQLVFDQQAIQKKLEEKVDQLARDMEVKQMHATTPDCTISGARSRVKIPFEVSVCDLTFKLIFLINNIQTSIRKLYENASEKFAGDEL